MKGNSLPKKLWIEISSKQIPKETSTKEQGKKHAYQNFSKETSLWTKISEGKSLPKKHFKEFLYQNFSQKIIPRKLWRDILRTKNTSLPKSPLRDIGLPKKKLEKNTYEKNTWRNISTKKWRNISNKKFETTIAKETWQESEDGKKCSLHFFSFDFCRILLSYCFWHAAKLKWISWNDLTFQCVFDLDLGLHFFLLDWPIQVLQKSTETMGIIKPTKRMT